MLKKFKCTRFKNFKNEIVFDLSNTKNYEFNKNCINIKKGIVKTGVIYGKNNSGKSNLGRGIIDILVTLTDLPLMPDSNAANTFINADTSDGTAEFYFEFSIYDTDIIYSYKKTSLNQLAYESLTIKGIELYSYNFQLKNGDFTELLKSYPLLKTLNFNKIESDSIAILKWILNNSQISEDDILHKFVEYIRGFAAVRISESRTGYTGQLNGNLSFTPKSLIAEIVKTNKVGEFTQFLSEVGLNIKLKIGTDENNEPSLFFDYKNPIHFYNNASSGTRVLTILYGIIALSKNITFLYLDELDANLHFEMAEYIIRKLSNNDFQVIVTSHNTDLMSNTILRPDCYFILTSENIVPLHQATTRELRMGHNLEKLYQSGEFTA